MPAEVHREVKIICHHDIPEVLEEAQALLSTKLWKVLSVSCHRTMRGQPHWLMVVLVRTRPTP